jgi:hypothetical protein
MSVISYILTPNPGYAYGLIGFLVVASRRGRPHPADKLQAIVWAGCSTFAAALACWFLWANAPASYDLFLKTLTVLVLETAVLALLPVPLLDGGELFQNRPYTWLAIYTPMLSVWLYLIWAMATASLWKQLGKTAAVFLAMATVSLLLWSLARRRAARMAGPRPPDPHSLSGTNPFTPR